MTIDEMHITVEQDLQKINSYANANVLSEEIDFHLNRNTRNFVDNVVGKLRSNPATSTDFQDNQRLLDSIHTLHVKNYPLTAFINDGDKDLVGGILPSNYRHLVKDSSELSRICIGSDKVQIEKKVYTYPFLFLAEGGLLDLELEIEGMLVFKLSNFSGYSDGVDADTKYQLVNLILDNVPNVYWEYYGNTYKKNTFLYVSDESVAVKRALNGESIEDVAEVTIAYKTYRFLEIDDLMRRPNRLNKDVNLDFVRVHPFEKTTWEYPVSTIANNQIFVYQDTDFKVRNVVIDYIRRPKTVSKSMSINSDLPEDAQERILEQTIIHLKGIIQDPSWQMAVQQNQLNTK